MATVPGNDVGALLLGVGVGMPQVVLAARFMYFTPNNSDPDSPSIMIIVRGLQMGLNRVNASWRLAEDGKLGPRTGTALKSVMPAEVVVGTTPWYKIFGYVYQAMQSRANPDELTRVRPDAPSSAPPMASLTPGAGGGGGAGMMSAGFGDKWLIAGALVLGYLAITSKPKRKRRRS